VKKLSEQLEAVAKAPGICVHPGYVEVLRRAIALAKRYEDAPVAIMDTRDALGLCAPTEADFPALYAIQGQRVRILLDTDPNPHQ
jgi:hypothetical protein